MKKRIFLLVFAGLFGFLFCLGVSASETQTVSGTQEPILSYGLNCLAENRPMRVSGGENREWVLSCADFCRSLNLAEDAISYVTVSALPDVTQGELQLGNTRIDIGQKISQANLSLLRFVAYSDGCRDAEVFFTVNGSAYPIECFFVSENEKNEAPILSAEVSLYRLGQTYENLSLCGQLRTQDEATDRLQYVFVSYPAHGSVIWKDGTAGVYEYRPEEGYTGEDSFAYAVFDSFGAWSEAAQVGLKVLKPQTDLTWADVADEKIETCVRRVSEAGIMTGTVVGNCSFFFPDKEISRAEFTAMALNAMGMTELPSCEKTVFADDELIPDALKTAVQTAYRLGYVYGETDEKGNLTFAPDRAVTRAEAACILYAMGNFKVSVSVFSGECPSWAAEAMSVMDSVGLMETAGERAESTRAIKKSEAAQMLAGFMLLKNR